MNENNHKQGGAIAVVGASALYPGSVGSSSFWNNILSGQDFMSEVPPDHWLIEDYYDPNPQAPGKVYARRGGFIPRVDFDPMHHGLPPKQLSTTDTAQLLGIVVAQKLLDDAASVQFGKVDKKNISVILGVASATELIGQMAARIQRPHWVKALREAGLPESEVQDACDRIEATYPEWDESTFPGLLGNVVAGRIANRLNLGGTNCVIDAACASSLGAVAMAVQELQLGHSDLVITGGVDALNDIFMFMCFSKTPALSPTGDCRPFSDDADGTMLGEGLGMLALRRLEDAERDGDKIYAVIRGIGSASDGRAKSIYAPRAEGQELAIRRAYERAGYGPEEVGLLEAHGTATKAGDLAEFGGLTRAFAGTPRDDLQWCALGSIKSQIGHTKAAAGAASLFKAVMALHHKVLPPTIKVNKPSAKLDIETTPFYLNTEARPWIHPPGRTRKASVSSFGFGGSNFHVALEEYAGSQSSARRFASLPVHLLLLDGSDAATLLARADAARAAVGAQGLARCARASQLTFDARAPYRLALLARDGAAAIADLDHAIATIGAHATQSFTLANRLHYSAGHGRSRLAFLFPGQGSQYVNMGAALAIGFDAVRRSWDDVAALPSEALRDLHKTVFPIPVFSDAEREAQAARLTQTDRAQPAIAATSLSMLRLLEQLGIAPDATAGHSFGEVTALYAAGALATPHDLLAVACRRGELMKVAASTPGAMLAMRCGAAEAQALIDRHGADGVRLANVNGPSQVVVAGPTPAIERFQAALQAEGAASTRLPVAAAFHTDAVAASAAPFGAFLQDVAVTTPRIPVYGNTLAAPYVAAPANIRATLAQQLAESVQFEAMVGRMHDDGCRLFVEVGPGSALTAMVGDCLKGRDYAAVSCDSRKLDGRTAFMNVLAVLSCHGVAVDYTALWEEFAEFDAPDDAAKLSPATVKLGGANYGKPYPTDAGVADRPAPNPERVMAPPPAVTPAPPVRTMQSAPLAPTFTAAAVRVATPATSPAGAAEPVPAAPVSAQIPVNGEWAAAFQALQQQTLDAQKHFTQTLADSHQAFLHASETAFMQLGAMGGAAATTAPVHQPAMRQAAMRAPEPLSVPAPAPATAPTLVPTPVPVPAPAPVPPPVAAAGRAPAVDYKALLLKVVSEKTGYPVEMLTLDMELEAGLGIDSIKHVEILAALQHEVPALAGVGTAEMSALNTLGEIVAFAAGAVPAGQPVSSPVAAGDYAPAVDYKAILLKVVSEKTGYPVEMLTLDMELEAGLGIDSIKRVEILAALQHEVPALAGVGTAEMSALNTLGEIVAFAAGAVPSGPVLSAAAAAPVAAAAAPDVDYHALLLQVVADKTGYPASMLTLDMELEAGLGIDSIKRVEILAALQEKIPQLAGVDTGRLAALNTLGEILTFASPVPGAAPTMAAVTAVAAPIIPASAVDHQAVLLEVVADKTGYPASMLTLDMELEAGLGIDSIKRVEILAALQQKIPALADLDTGRLAALNTLGEILAFALDASGVASSPSGAAAVVGPAAPGLQRFEVRSAPARSSGLATPGLFAAAPLYLLGGAAIAAALAVRLEAAGIDVRVVDVLPADACSAVLLGALDADADAVAAQAALNEAAFLGLQPCADTMAAQGNLLVTVQDTGGDFGLGGAMGARAWSTGIAALAKTAALEWPHVSVKAIDIACDGRGSDAIAEALALELLAGGPQLEAGLLASGERVAPVLWTETHAAPAPAMLANDGVVVVSGGARGVTAECLAALAGRVPGVKLAILGRTPLCDEPAGLAACATDAQLKGALLARHKADGHAPTPTALGAEVRELLAQRELRANLARLEALGASVRYMAVDVVDAAAVRQVLDGIRTEFGPIRGLVHAAGVLADKEIRRKTLPQFQHVFSTKVDGLHNLLAATHDDALTHIVCFSSVAAWRGNVGQADYAMANEVLNRVCAAERARRGPACLVKSIGWGPWAGGMVGANLEQHFAAMGVALIPLADGARLFADEFTGQNGAATGIVFGGGLEQFTAAGPRRESAGFDVRFHRATHPLIAGHVIRGTPVVPLVMVNDLAVQAVQALCPVAKVGGSANLRVVKGMQLRHFDGTGDRYRIECRRGADPDVVAVKVVDAGGVLYYTLDVALGAADARPAPAAPANLREWRPSSGAIYDGRLFHGAGLQVIKKLDGIGPGGGACTLAPDTSPQPGFAAPVDVLDGGLQLAVLWLHEQAGCESLPTGVGRILVHERPMHGATVQCEAVCESRTNLVAQFTIVYRDAAGEPLATLERLTMHLLPDALSAGASATVAIADVV